MSEEVPPAGAAAAATDTPPAPVAPAAAVEEGTDIFLGDKIRILGGRLNGTEGRIYYRDAELIRLMPLGARNMLIDIPLDAETGGFSADLAVQEVILDEANHRYLQENVVPFVSLADLVVGQFVETFNNAGEAGPIFKIMAVNEENDSATLQDETRGELRLEFSFIGIPREQPFTILAPRERISVPEAAGTAANNAAPTEEEVSEEQEIAFELLEEADEAATAAAAAAAPALQIIPSALQFFPDFAQKTDMLQDLLSGLSPAEQKNPRKIKQISRLVESLFLLRNTLAQYDRDGRPAGQKETSFETLSQLLEDTPFPLAKPIEKVARSVYLDHTQQDYNSRKKGEGSLDPTEAPTAEIDLHYLLDTIEQANAFDKTNRTGSAEETALPAGAIPPWYILWEQYFSQYARTFMPMSSENISTTPFDRDILRGYVQEEEAAVIAGIDPTTPSIAGLPKTYTKANERISADFLGEVSLSPLRALGPRRSRYGLIEKADEAEILSYLIFPLLFLRDIGTTRSNRLAMDVGFSLKEPSYLNSILKELPAEEIPTGDNIFVVRPDGTNLGNVPISEWLVRQPFYSSGLGDLMPILKSFGLTEKELTAEQQNILNKKIELYQIAIKQYLNGLREKEESRTQEEAAAPPAPQNLLEPAEAKALNDIIRGEPLLVAEIGQFQRRTPAYKDSDMAEFMDIFQHFQDYLLATLAQNVPLRAKEERRAKNDLYLAALAAALQTQKKAENSGEAPTPNPCEHVEALEKIRATKTDDQKKMALMVELLSTYRGEKKDHWFWCVLCKQHLLCEHEFLLLQEYLHPHEKDTLHKELLLAFSHGEFQGTYQCRVCGQSIGEIEYDTHVEFDEEGRPLMGRGVLVDKDALALEELQDALRPKAGTEEEITFDTDDKNLNYQTIKLLCFLLGIPMTNETYEKLVNRVQDEMNKLEPLEAYKAKAKGKKGALPYTTMVARYRIYFCAVFLLLDIQTKIPNYDVRTVIRKCSNPSFEGYPLGSSQDETGIQYMTCAILSAPTADEPFATASFDRTAAEKVPKILRSLLEEVTTMVEINNELRDKRNYLLETAGVEGVAGMVGIPQEQIPNGFTPLQVALPPDETAREPILAAAASEENKTAAWILTAHSFAREFSVDIRKTSPFSERTCCFGSLAKPTEFWQSMAGRLPNLPAKRIPRGFVGTVFYLSFKPRPMEALLGKPDERLMYRLFLSVCFTGPRVGYPHEPGYTHICPYCKFKFPDDPRLPPPTEEAEIEQKASRDLQALTTQQVEVSKATFEELLDKVHLNYQVEQDAPPEPLPAPDDLLGLIRDHRPVPYDGWASVLDATRVELGKLPAGQVAKRDVLAALVAISSATEEVEASLRTALSVTLSQRQYQRVVGVTMEGRMDKVVWGQYQKLIGLPFTNFLETLRTYYLVPIQRMIRKYDPASAFYIQKSYGLSSDTITDINKFLTSHNKFPEKFLQVLEGDESLVGRYRQFVDTLSSWIPFFMDRVRAPLLRAGTILLPTIQRLFTAAIFLSFLSEDRTNFAAYALTDCSIRFMSDNRQQDLSPEQIRQLIVIRNEMEKSNKVRRVDRMTEDQKRLYKLHKALGMGEFAMSGTTRVYRYNEIQYVLDRNERLEMGMVDFPELALINPSDRIEREGGDFGPVYDAENENMDAGDYAMAQETPDNA